VKTVNQRATAADIASPVKNSEQPVQLPVVQYVADAFPLQESRESALENF